MVQAQQQQKTQPKSGGTDTLLANAARKLDVSSAAAYANTDSVGSESASVVNGHGGQSRPVRLELQHDSDANSQRCSQTSNCHSNSLVAVTSAADVAVCKVTTSDFDCAVIASSPNVTVPVGSEKDSKITKPVNFTPAGRSQSGDVEINGNVQLSDAVGASSVRLPSPPPTPPTAKSRLSDSKQTVSPSPARGSFRSPARQDVRKNSTPDSVELPPPPSPPLQFCQSMSLDSPEGVLPPPPLDDALYAIPPRISPPPPMSPVSSANSSQLAPSVSKTAADMSAFITAEAEALLVDGLSALSAMSSGFDGEMQDNAETEPLVRDNRSDLLAAIREGRLSCCWHAFCYRNFY